MLNLAMRKCCARGMGYSRRSFTSANARVLSSSTTASEISPRPMLPGNKSLQECDPEMFALVNQELERQVCGIELIASENFTSRAVLETLGSCLTNKYSEGQPGGRYYGGNQVIDQVENLCKERALSAFGLIDSHWGVNVQPYSGSPANFAAYTALLNPHDRIMGLDLPDGGHLTHGFFTPAKKISATSIYFESLPYRVDPSSGLIDFDELRKRALLFRPKMIICGCSAYPRELDFAKFRQIADEVGAYLHADIAHISGLIATGLHPSPWQFADIVTSTTHKSLRGPRSGIIFYNNNTLPDMKERVDNAVFPALQGGPHNHQIGGLAVQLKEVATPEFKNYCEAVVTNARVLANELQSRGYKLATDGTDNHLILWDLRPSGLSGAKLEKLCDRVSITLNRNCVHGDKSALNPGGVRIGSCAMTTRGLGQEEFKMVGEFLDRAVKIGLETQNNSGKKLKDFERALDNNTDIQQLRSDVRQWAANFGYPGF